MQSPSAIKREHAPRRRDLIFIAPKGKQSTRMLKLACTKCGFTCRSTAKHIASVPEGLICPNPVCDGDLVRAS